MVVPASTNQDRAPSANSRIQVVAGTVPVAISVPSAAAASR